MAEDETKCIPTATETMRVGPRIRRPIPKERLDGMRARSSRPSPLPEDHRPVERSRKADEPKAPLSQRRWTNAEADAFLSQGEWRELAFLYELTPYQLKVLGIAPDGRTPLA